MAIRPTTLPTTPVEQTRGPLPGNLPTTEKLGDEYLRLKEMKNKLQGDQKLPSHEQRRFDFVTSELKRLDTPPISQVVVLARRVFEQSQ